MNYKHGFTLKEQRNKSNPKWRAHVTWLSMKARCDNPKNERYCDYGGRGITYDPRWKDFSTFVEDMGCPEPEMTLDRIDCDGNYSKENCRWADRATQNKNRRNARFLLHDGQYRTVTEWARFLGVPRRLLQVRLDRGWSVEDTLSRPSDTTAGQFKVGRPSPRKGKSKNARTDYPALSRFKGDGATPRQIS